jgi:16S rRNA G966 N2-methylase RsmD
MDSNKDEPIIIENFNPKNYFNIEDIKKIKNNQKLKITNIGKYSITKPLHTNWIKSLIIQFFKNKAINTKTLNIIDSTACIGGDSLSFSKYFKHVLSIEKDKTHFEILESNIKICETDNIKIIHNDFISYIENEKLYKSYQILFIDPPWGGPDYKNVDKLDLFMYNNQNIKINIKTIINSYIDKFKYIVLKCPNNFYLNKSDYLYKNIHSYIANDNKVQLIILEK